MSVDYDKIQKEIMDSILPMVHNMSNEAISAMINEMAILPQELKDAMIQKLLSCKTNQI